MELNPFNISHLLIFSVWMPLPSLSSAIRGDIFHCDSYVMIMLRKFLNDYCSKVRDEQIQNIQQSFAFRVC